MKAQTKSLPRLLFIPVIALLVIGLVFIAYQRQSVLASGPGGSSLAEASQGFVDAFAAKDAERIVSYFADDVIAMYPLESVPEFGIEVNLQNWIGAFEIMDSHPITSDIVAEAKSKDVGYTLGRFCALGIQDVGDLCGRYVATWDWTKSGWKITLLSALIHEDVLPADVTGN